LLEKVESAWLGDSMNGYFAFLILHSQIEVRQEGMNFPSFTPCGARRQRKNITPAQAGRDTRP